MGFEVTSDSGTFWFFAAQSVMLKWMRKGEIEGQTTRFLGLIGVGLKLNLSQIAL